MTTSPSSSANAEPESRIDALLQALTLGEKVSLLAGATFWTTNSVERLNIPAIKVSDGPNGARGGGGLAGGSVTSACFPVGISLASTWNTALIEQIGQALGQEAKSKGAIMLLAPTVNIHRSPLNGRNFECYSEDPYLSARMAVGYINGVQSENVGTTVKHFIANDSEFERNTISSEVDERTLREIYLPPFQAAIQEAQSWGLMSAYNRINGVHADEHRELLLNILKQEWSFDGIVMSDWGGTNSTVNAANNGLDLEMPGPPRFRGKKLLAAAEAGEVDLAAIDDSVRRILRIMQRSGALDNPPEDKELSNDRPEHRALIRSAAAEGIVLLKNEDAVLPLSLEESLSIAIIGPNARVAQIMGGGSAQVNTHYSVSPFEGIVATVDASSAADVQMGYEIGTTNHKLLPRLDPELVTPPNGTGKGFAMAYYNNLDLSGEPVYQTVSGSSEQMWLGNVAPDVQPRQFSARMSGRFTPRESGAHSFGISSAGLARFSVDNRVMVDKWSAQTGGDPFFGEGRRETTTTVDLQAGQTYTLELDYSSGNTPFAGMRLGYLPPVGEDAIDRAVALAAQSDVALVFVGLNGDWESESFDRPDLELVGQQNELITAVAAANPRTVVVVQTGSPISMPWLDQVAAVMQAWYPGQECGNAISDVLFGTVNPSGKLPQTFPMRLQDNPAYINYPGEHGRVRYGEGIFVGYRYYEMKDIEPLFPFGFGLSYTTFAYDNLRLSADSIGPDDGLTIGIDVTNTGQRAGQEIVQLYVRDVAATVARPLKELKGFGKVSLEPGETKTVPITIDRTALAFWDDEHHAWVAEAGDFEVLIGSSSQHIRARATFQLTQTATFGGPPAHKVALTIDSTIKTLLDDPGARSILERHIPDFASSPALAMGMSLTLGQIAGFAPDLFPEETLRAIAADLEASGAADADSA